MITKKRLSNSLFIFFCALSCYSFGTAMMDYFLLYPSRFLVGEKEFVNYHTFLESAILPISVFPFLLITVLNIFLFWFRPRQISKGWIWISLGCLILDLISTGLIQAPWNFELSAGKNEALMQKITDTNWGRVVLESVQFLVVLVMLHRCDSTVSVSSTAAVSRA